jgi:predicted transcriptional regulator
LHRQLRIIHTLQQHGNPLSEARRGQIAVEKEDFVKYLDVFLCPDEIRLLGKTKRTQLPLLEFVKVLDGKKFVIKEVRTVISTKKMKASRLIFHTMYKIKVSK